MWEVGKQFWEQEQQNPEQQERQEVLEWCKINWKWLQKEISQERLEAEKKLLETIIKRPDYKWHPIEKAIENCTILIDRVPWYDYWAISLTGESLDFLFNLDNTPYFSPYKNRLWKLKEYIPHVIYSKYWLYDAEAWGDLSDKEWNVKVKIFTREFYDIMLWWIDIYFKLWPALDKEYERLKNK